MEKKISQVLLKTNIFFKTQKYSHMMGTSSGWNIYQNSSWNFSILMNISPRHQAFTPVFQIYRIPIGMAKIFRWITLTFYSPATTRNPIPLQKTFFYTFTRTLSGTVMQNLQFLFHLNDSFNNRSAAIRDTYVMSAKKNWTMRKFSLLLEKQKQEWVRGFPDNFWNNWSRIEKTGIILRLFQNRSFIMLEFRNKLLTGVEEW